MSDDRLEQIINTAADHYNVPPVNPPLDEMWAAIEVEAFAPRMQAGSAASRSLVHNPWLRMAAVLVLGVAIGRYTMPAPVSAPAQRVAEVHTPAEAASSYALTTERYLGQTMTLLANLPGELQDGQTDPEFVTSASQSLADLRVLMDSPAASNPRLRALFEDLELVLVQVVQMPTGGSRSDAKLIRQAMQERDVMPRLVDAVADTPNF